jgi:hypothetical protein
MQTYTTPNIFRALAYHQRHTRMNLRIPLNNLENSM